MQVHNSGECLIIPPYPIADLDSVMALQTDLTSDEELSTTIDLSDAQVFSFPLQLTSVMLRYLAFPYY